MTIRTVGVLGVQVVLRTRGLLRADAMRHAMARETELRYPARNQHARIRRTVRRMTGDAAFGLDRGMFVNKRTLFVCVALDASRIGASRQSRLFKFETAMRIVAIAALHRTFEYLVMEGQIELVLSLTMTTQAKLRFAVPEQPQIREARLLRVCC